MGRVGQLAAMLLAGLWPLGSAAQVAPAVIEWSSTSYRIAENAGPANLTVTRSGNLNSPVTVEFATADGTANAVVDYIAENGRLSFGAGETNKTVRITILDDSFAEGDETVKLSLRNPSQGALLGPGSNATLTIQDNEKAVGLLDGFNPQLPQNNGLIMAVPHKDGGVIVAVMDCNGPSGCIARLIRLLRDGSPDPAFGPVTDIKAPQSYGLTFQALAVQPDGKVLIGGNFTNANGSPVKGIARFNADGTSDVTFNTNATVTLSPSSGQNGPAAFAVQDDGKIVLGGSFTRVNGVAHNNLARLNADGTLDTNFNARADSNVSRISVLRDGRLLVLGGFTTLGKARAGIGILNPDGSVDDTFRPQRGTSSGGVNGAIALADGQVLIGGYGAVVTGTSRRGLALLSADGTVNTNFNANMKDANGNPPNVASMAQLADGTILLSGSFTNLAGIGRTNFARLLPNLTADASFALQADGVPQWMFAEPGGTVLLVNGFGLIAGLNRPGLARINGDANRIHLLEFSAAQYSTMGGGAPAVITVQRRGETSGALRVDYSTSDGTGTAGLNYQPQSGTLQFAPLQTSASFTVPTFADLIFDGAKTAKLRLNNPEPEAQLGVASTAVLMIEENAQGPHVVAGSLSAIENAGFVAVTLQRAGDLSAPLEFSYSTSDGSGLAGRDYAPQSGRVRFGTNQASVSIQVPLVDNGQVDGPRNFKLTLTGSTPFRGASTALVTVSDNEVPVVIDSSFHSSSFAPQTALLQPDGKIIIAGSFTNVGGLSRTGIARLNADGSVDTGFDPGTGVQAQAGFGTVVTALALQPDGKIILSGDFFVLGGVEHFGIGRLNADGSVDTNFVASMVSQQSGMAHGLVVRPEGQILVVGNVAMVNGTPQNDIMQLNADGTVDTSFKSNVHINSYNWTGPAMALQPDGKLLLGGNGITIGTTGSSAPMIRLSTNGTPDKSFSFEQQHGNETMGSVNALALLPDGKILAAGFIQFSEPDAEGKTGRNGIARFNSNGTVDTTFRSTGDYPANQITVLADGRILLDNGTLLRSDGALDRTLTVTASRYLLQPDQRVIVVGAGEGGMVRFFTDSNHPGGPEFTASAASVTESDGAITLAVQRIGDSSQPFTVDYATVDGTALAGREYVAQTGTLHFAALQSTNAITVPILNNALVNGTRDFQVALRNPTGRTVLQFHDKVTVTISDNDSGIQFARDAFSVNEAAGVAEVLLTRRGDQLGVAAVDLVTSDGTATAGSDYLAYHSTLFFAAGEKDKTVPISILDDGLIEGAETVRLTLTNARGATALGSLTNALLSIIDNELAPAVDISFNAGLAASQITGLGVQSDGKIIVAGGFSQFAETNRAGLVRLKLDGSLDLSFAKMADQNGTPYINGLIVQSDDKLLIWGNGGLFGNGSGILRFNPDGTRDTQFRVSFSQSNRGTSLQSVVLQPDGKMLVSGGFDRVNGTTIHNICRLEPDGTVDTNFVAAPSRRFNSQEQGSVYRMALQPDGKIFINGDYNMLNGVPVNGYFTLRLNPDGTVDSTFQSGNANQVLVVQPDNRAIVQGPQGYSRLNPDGSIDPTFRLPAGVSISLPALIQPDGKLLCAGSVFDGGIYHGGLIRLNTDGSLDGTLPAFWMANYGSGNFIAPSALALQRDGMILAGGEFLNVNAQPRGHLVRLFGDTSGPAGFQFSSTRFGAGESDGFAVVTVQRLGNSTQPASVDFSTGNNLSSPAGDYVPVAGPLHFQPFEVQKTFTVPIAFDPVPGADAMLALRLDRPSAGFSFGASVPAAELMISDAQRPGSVDTSFNPFIETTNSNGSSGFKLALQPDGKIITAGNFQRVNGVKRNGVCRLNLDGSLDLSFDPKGGLDFSQYPDVYALAVQPDGKLLIRGFFNTFDGVTVTNFIRLNVDGSLDTAFNPDPAVATLNMPTGSGIAVQPDGRILVTENSDLARLDPTGSPDSTFEVIPVVGVNGWWSASFNVVVVEPDGRSLFEGDIGAGGGDVGWPRPGLTRLNTDGSLDETFRPIMDNGGLNSLALLPDGKILINGSFNQISAIDRPRIARLNSNGSLDEAFAPPIDLVNNAGLLIAAQADGKALITFNENGVSTILRLNSDGSPDASFDVGRGGFQQIYGAVEPTALLPLPDGRLLVSGSFTSVNGVDCNGLVMLTGDEHLATAAPRFRSISRANAQKTLLTLDVVPNRTLILQTSANLIDWVPLPGQFTTNYVLGLTNIDSNSSPQRFYRAVQAPR